jgi:hypothetical protein
VTKPSLKDFVKFVSGNIRPCHSQRWTIPPSSLSSLHHYPVCSLHSRSPVADLQRGRTSWAESSNSLKKAVRPERYISSCDQPSRLVWYYPVPGCNNNPDHRRHITRQTWEILLPVISSLSIIPRDLSIAFERPLPSVAATSAIRPSHHKSTLWTSLQDGKLVAVPCLGLSRPPRTQELDGTEELG